MARSLFNKSWRGRGHNSEARKLGSPQVKLPSHLSAWPDVKAPKAPNSASKAQSGKKSFTPAKGEIAFDRSYEPKGNVVRTGADDQDADTKMNSSPLTLEDGSSERKERLKDATASQKRDKSTGKKKHKEKGGSENVFNARSPPQEFSGTLMRDKSTTPTQPRNRANLSNSPAFSLPASGANAVSIVRNENGNTTPRKSLTKLLGKSSNNDSSKAASFQSPSVASTRNGQNTFQPTTAYQSSQANSAAVTEAQRQANLLRRSGHQEFSSHAFDASDDDEGEPKFDETTTSGKKKNKKKGNVEDVELDPVQAEIAKQQASYNDYMAERMKKNPDHYVDGGANFIQELISDEESDYESIHNTNTPRSGTYDHGHPSRSTTKKDKDRRKRSRDRDDELFEEDVAIEGSRKKLKVAGSKEHGQFGIDIPSTASTATHPQHQKPVSLQQLREQLKNAAPMTFIAENANANAEFMTTLKSFWGIIPKALLHTTMINLNKANRRSLDAKLKLCQEGKQTNPHIRIVTRTDTNGDEIELLEEYGKISEPDPHTMSSELTLLTAAKDLIVLLSGQRVGLDLSSVVSPSAEAETKRVGSQHRSQGTPGNAGERSLLEEELTRIAGEYQKEIDSLREENQKLAVKLKKSKR